MKICRLIINILFLRPCKKTNTTILKVIVKLKIFNLFFGLILHKDNKIFYLKKCFIFYFY